jgi:radical SAM superfamily enzyme YgiQ (UPF0313 family)
MSMEMVYDYPLYRPPSEANSMIFQVTLGCSFNKCSYCNMYRSKEYAERPFSEIVSEINWASKVYPNTQRVFLADGDALNLGTDKLVEILSYIKNRFSKIERISCYAMPKNLVQKTEKDLIKLREHGLNLVYVGIETGNDNLLRKITKGATAKTIIDSCKKAKKTELKLSCMVILGIGGKRYTIDHIRDTAKVVNEASPDYLAALSLILEDGIYSEFMTKYGEPFKPLEDLEILDELERLVGFISPKSPILFRANHASNLYSIGGTLAEDKSKILSVIDNLKNHPEMLKPKVLRRF